MNSPRVPLPDDARVPLPGSTRDEWAGARVLGPLDADEQVSITLVLRRRAEPDAAAFAGQPLTREQLGARYGADPDALATVTAAITAAGATVVSADAASRLVRVSGPSGVLSSLFGTSLQQVERAGDTGRQRTGELVLPNALADPLQAVLGLDDRPQAAARYRSAAPSAVTSSYTPLQLAKAYGMPDADGSGQTIAIIELGGGFGQDDLDSYFGGLNLTAPSVTAVSVDGAQNAPGADPTGADGEVLLDVEVVGAIAPKATQLVYFAPNTDDGFLDAVTQAAHASPAPTAMSISWGQSEDQWTAQARKAMDDAFADAVLLGVTVTAAAGDDGSADRQTDNQPHADFPASSPHVLGCGGTRLELKPDGSISSEVVWDDGGTGGATGGGISQAFDLPDYQSAAGVPTRSGSSKAARGVPDVAGVADPQTGYQVLIDGKSTVIGGTSAVAPLWAGLISRLAQLTGKKFGLLHPTIYAGAPADGPATGFHDITQGSNGAYSADAGWDACTGLGTPDGAKLLGVVQGATG